MKVGGVGDIVVYLVYLVLPHLFVCFLFIFIHLLSYLLVLMHNL